MNTENSIFEKLNNWIKNSVMLKLLTITILMLLLLIPTSMIESIIGEREQLNMEATAEVSSKWAGQQEINGPILTIPVLYEINKEDKKEVVTRYWHILPENLNIKGEIIPEKLRRGIYEIVVYKSDISVTGDFVLDHHLDQTHLTEIQYDRAFLTIGVSDLRGIKSQMEFKLNKDILRVEPGSRVSQLIYSGVTIDLPNLTAGQDFDFEFTLDLQGSQNMTFVPIGSTTKVQVSSAWSSPSFNGNFLPDFREVNTEGFTANWKILQLNRNFPQSWTGSDQAGKMQAAAFGVDLILPLDDYQKSTRSAKYGVMTIALTFLIFFLVEILYERKIHPFQYVLVGLALCLFYVLLVSITEHSDFNTAYGISTFGIVTMVTLYSLSIFKVKKLVLMLVATLSGIYGFLFVTLQLADFALLMGSIGLTLILAATMYFTRNINWYNLNIDKD